MVFDESACSLARVNVGDEKWGPDWRLLPRSLDTLAMS